LVWRRFAGQFGNPATTFALKKKKIRSPIEIICLASSIINYWAGLQKDEDKGILEEGAEALKNAALLHHSQDQDHGEPQAGTVLLQ
jgi:hypothetical protein